MAEIVLGIGSSHAPQLSLPPDQWWRRTEFDKKNPRLWFQGKTYNFPELVRERSDDHFEDQLGPELAQSRWDACQKAIDALSDTLKRVNPDVCIIMGDDQDEVFQNDNMPSLSVFWGDAVDTAPPGADRESNEAVIDPEKSRFPRQRTSNPTVPDLGSHIIKTLIEDDFDPAHSRRLPPGRHGDHGIGHAFSYVYRRLMKDDIIPHVPIFLNTYYPPNQPTMNRCYELGLSLRRAVESWESEAKVAVIASGGLSHFVIEEDIDEHIIQGLKDKDRKALTDLPYLFFNSGTSEIRNWVTLAAAMQESDLQAKMVDYQPCYRSEAGTGCAMGFAEWL